MELSSYILETQPTISIIIAVYNSALTLERSLNSFISQSYPYKELIVIDGGSSDGSIDIISNNKDIIAYWESEQDRGIAHAWNKGVHKASGDWIYFLGADDYLWDKNTLQRVAQFLANVPEDIKIAYGKVARVQNNDQIVDICGKSWEEIRHKFFYGMALHHQGVFHHKTLFEQYGDFDEYFQLLPDYEMLLRYLKQHDATFIEIIIAGALLGGISTDSKNRINCLNEFTKAAIKQETKVLTITRIYYYIRSYIRLILTIIFGIYLTDKVAIKLRN